MSRIERSNEKYNRAAEKQAIDPDIDRRWNKSRISSQLMNRFDNLSLAAPI